MLIAVSSISGSPGVSAWTLMLAAAWPDPQTRILVEADPSGGVLAARYGLSSDPGVVTLVSQARLHLGHRPELQSCGRRLDANLWCIPGPETAEGAGHIWSGGAQPLAECLAGDDRLWFVDCGRIYPNTTLSPLLSASDLHLLFVGSSTESLVAVPSRVSWLSEHAPTCVVSVGNSGRHPDEMLKFFGSERVWQVGYQRDLSKIAGQVFESGRARRSKAWRAAVEISDNICHWLNEQTDSKQREGVNQHSAATPTLDAPGGKQSANNSSVPADAPPPSPEVAETGLTLSDSLAPPISTPDSSMAAAAPIAGRPRMPSEEFKDRPSAPKLPPVSRKSGWSEPLPEIPDDEPKQAHPTATSEAG